MASATHQYLTSVLRRGTVRWPQDDHLPDWEDRPRVRKAYPVRGAVPFESLVSADEQDLRVHLTALHRAFAFQDRRIEVSPNDRPARSLSSTEPTYGRAASSGGGLYPIELYLRTGGSGTVDPGTYYVDWVGQQLVPLALGPSGGSSRQEIFVTVRYWANAFKYGEFTYHVVAMDVGSLLLTFREVIAERGVADPDVRIVSGQSATRSALGIEGAEEDVYAVITVRDGAQPDTPPVALVPAERSRTVTRFLQTAGVIAASDDEGPGERRWSTPGLGLEDLETALRRRHSSFGRFRAAPVDGDTFRHVAAMSLRAADGLATSLGTAPVELLAACWTVTGLDAGVHRFDRQDARWVPTGLGLEQEDLQRHYFLDNYDLGQAGAAAFPMVTPRDFVEEGRAGIGYRALNALVGALAQSFYLAAADAGLGCGAMLGFDNTGAGSSLLPEPPTDLDSEWPYLLLAFGAERLVMHRFTGTFPTAEVHA